MKKDAFEALTSPRSVAVIGASLPETSWYGGRTYGNLCANNVGRTIYPINPRLAGRELLGNTVYASVADLPQPPDLTVIATPWSTVVGLLAEAGKAGTRAALVLGSYKGEDPDGVISFDAAINAVAREFDLPVVGPNSMGFINGNRELVATFGSGADHGVRPGRMAFLSQSGAAISYQLQLYAHKQFGYSHLVSTGNEAAVTLPEVLEHVVEDEGTETILLFLEGISDGARLRRALARAQLLGKPVAMYKVGRSEIGQAAAQSHTGRLASDADGLRALVEETGVQLTTSYEELFDLGAHFATTRRRRMSQRSSRSSSPQPRAAVIGTSGGVGVATCDDLVESGWTLPPLSRETMARLRSVTGAENLPEHLENPIDVTGTFGDTSRLGVKLPEIARIVSDSGDYDEVFIASGAGGMRALNVATNLANELRTGFATPITVGWVAIDEQARAVLDAAKVSVFSDPSRAVRAATALDASGRRGHQRAQLQQLVNVPTVPPASTDRPVRMRTAGSLFDELSDAGLSTADYELLDPLLGPDDALAAAARVGYPVVMKIDSSEMVHKSDSGGLVLNIDSEDKARRAWETLTAIVPAQDTSARILVQRSLAGVEVLVGARWDAQLGHLLVVGLGGTLTELVADFRATLLPTYEGRFADLVAEHERLTALLSGYRGAAPASTSGLIRLLERTAAWLCAKGGAVRQLDFNPVIVTATDALVVDARMVGEQ